MFTKSKTKQQHKEQTKTKTVDNQKSNRTLVYIINTTLTLDVIRTATSTLTKAKDNVHELAI